MRLFLKTLHYYFIYEIIDLNNCILLLITCKVNPQKVALNLISPVGSAVFRLIVWCEDYIISSKSEAINALQYI
jgi:hypothetical protein